MPRILGVNIPEEKRIEFALTYLKGIGVFSSRKILEEAGIDINKRAKDITSEEVGKIQKIIEKNHKIEGELKRIVMMNIKRLKEIGCYRGTRHAKGLPTRGQRTKTNNRTVRGNIRRTAGSGRSKLEKT
ncbi:30S ribosomal protein S13 [Patescibacteria group bacterium]|nr:30S ribosomal protein S13 [Candidatus Andersenbacteria bacterium]NOQ68108.1 30S ribosomal protein S13 [Patescibacteria group bacterium]